MTEAPALPQAETLAECLLLKTGRQDCVINFFPARYQLHLAEGDQRIDLGYSGSRLLERLLRSPGEVVSREDLLQYAWTDRVVGQGSLNQQIYILRQILGDERERQIIQTLPRRGYLFNAGFLLSTSPAGDGAQAQAEAPSHVEPAPAPDSIPAAALSSMNSPSPALAGVHLGAQFYAGLVIGSLLSILALQILHSLPH